MLCIRFKLNKRRIQRRKRMTERGCQRVCGAVRFKLLLRLAARAKCNKFRFADKSFILINGKTAVFLDNFAYFNARNALGAAQGVQKAVYKRGSLPARRINSAPIVRAENTAEKLCAVIGVGARNFFRDGNIAAVKVRGGHIRV